MNYIKTFELFDFFKKKSKVEEGSKWKVTFNKIWDWYKNNKSKKEIPLLELPHVSIDDNSASIAIGFKDHVCFYGKNSTGKHKLEVVDFSECDIYDPKSNDGVYKLTQSEYDEYYKKISEVNNWLDHRSDETFNKSSTSVSKDGSIDINTHDMAIDELNYELNNKLDIIGKTFEFELSYHMWTSGSSNVLMVDRHNLKVEDVKFSVGGDRIYAEIITNNPHPQKGIDNVSIWIESDSPKEYYDFESHKWPYHDDKDKFLRIHPVEKQLSRSQKRNIDKERIYPSTGGIYSASPCKYDSIEMVKSVIETLMMLNEEMKKRK